jgi:ABC-type branched-subunit amino acid transport system ATPase component
MDEPTKYRYVADINSIFTPGSPIDSRDLFAGRTKQVEKVISTIFQKGSHAILFGERGVGKTSLANTLFDFLVMTGKFHYQRAKVNCSQGMGKEW